MNPPNREYNSRPATESTLKRTQIVRPAQPNVLQRVSCLSRRIPFDGITQHASRITPSRLYAFTLLILLALFFLPLSTAAQTQPQSYWQYAAPRRIDHVIVSDVNRDGMDEFILAVETGQVDLLSSDGILQWSYGNAAGASVQALAALNNNGPEQTIALVMENQLILLDGSGNLLWKIRLKTTDPPPALLTAGGIESQAEWETKYQPQVLQIEPFDADGDGRDEILILFNTGQLILYDGNGNEIWRNNDAFIIPADDARPQLAVDDINQDGLPEIALGYFNPRLRYSVLSLLGSDGVPLWPQNQPISGRITAVTLIPFSSNGQLQIAVSTDRGSIHLYEANRRRVWWPRTLNVPITALAVAQLPEGTALLAGTTAGSIMAYSATGYRFWTRHLDPLGERAILNLSTANFAARDNLPALAAVLEAAPNSGLSNDVLLLNGRGRILKLLEAADTNSLTQLLDINRDENSELLLVRFANVALQGIGAGASQIAPNWSYPLNAAPSAFLIVDLDRDGEDELLVGARDGRLHYLKEGSEAEWKVAPGGEITHLAVFDAQPDGNPRIVVARKNLTPANPEGPAPQSWIELRSANGERIWEQPLVAGITSLALQSVAGQANPEIIVGTESGDILAFSPDGVLLQERSLYATAADAAPVTQLLVIETPQIGQSPILAASDRTLFNLTADPENGVTAVAQYSDPIQTMFPLAPSSQPFSANIILFLADQINSVNWQGSQQPDWTLRLPGQTTAVIPANDIANETQAEIIADSFLVGTDKGSLLRLTVKENQPEINWQLDGLENISSLYWGDLDGDALPEIVVGSNENNTGLVRLFSYQTELLDELPLAGAIVALGALHYKANQPADLLVATENGEIRAFRAQENRPPLLTNPTTTVVEGQYGISVNVADVESDNVMVRLETLNPATGEWVNQGEEWAASGNGRLIWLVEELPGESTAVTYRFAFDDGAQQGIVTPPAGPPPISPVTFFGLHPVVFSLMVLAGAGVLALVFRQTQLPTMRARAFYKRLASQPNQTLPLLAQKYSDTYGSADFLLNLANTARQKGNSLISNLADGLYLLSERPYVGLSILASTLGKINRERPLWQDIELWQRLFNTGLALLEAPSVTELSLLQPQLEQLLDKLEEYGRESDALNTALPILTNLRDSERVERTDDRLIYLNEAARCLNELQYHMPIFAPCLEKTLTAALTRRWAGLISAEQEELRGRAEMYISLKTKRIVSSEETQVTLEIKNNGRAPAENIVAELEDDPAYLSQSEPQIIPFLPPGHSRVINFTITPRVADRFRLGLRLTYNDRNSKGRTMAFGDMVHLLLPEREFSLVSNPYLPGTPLRSHSDLFYGREQLFNFIADNAGGWSQRNVLILIGQRRTGKTSLLLRLETQLPDNLLPVYIDCQSLGVTPGMGNLFHDLAWLIADALALRDMEIDVPDLAVWEANPTHTFQRQFLPQAQALMPPNATLLLVFDEFEVFEHLVNDGILPPTFFNFMRHLMQHSQGLSFIFVGTRRLEEMGADYWSVLFNIALYERIDYLSPEAAVHLITEPVAPHLVYDDLALDKILRVTAGHPYFVQLVCYTLVKQANERGKGYVTISDVNDGLDEMLSLGEVHFAYLWQRSTPTERALLTAVAHMDSDLAFHPEDFLEFLGKYNIHVTPSEVTAALQRLVERGIIGEVTQGASAQYELKLGLVGLWVAKHKSLSKLHAAQTNGARQNGKQLSVTGER